MCASDNVNIIISLNKLYLSGTRIAHKLLEPIVLVSSEGSAEYVYRHSVAKAVADPEGLHVVCSNPPPCPVFKYSMKMK